VAIADEKYVLLTTFRKNGVGMPTPVWIVALPDGTAGFTTEIDSGKVKRVRNNPSVTLQPCSLRGKVTADAEVVAAKADVLVGADARAVTKAVRRKYRVAILLLDIGTLFRKLFRRAETEECAIRLRFD
jgi:PPOX class probable F420-dependent enzyme